MTETDTASLKQAFSNEFARKGYHPQLGATKDAMEALDLAILSVGFAQCSREQVIEECAKVAESFHRWIGSADQANAFDKEGIAARIRALSQSSTLGNSK